ncbi:MAG: choline dehydrogenase [Flavobacteriaceae bacterium]
MPRTEAALPEGESFDYVIVGSGSAGSALAYRLAEADMGTILVIEYGGSDFGPLIQMPAAFAYPMNMKRYDWGFRTQPEPHLGGRVLATPRGKVIGGSSSINGMVFVRGHPDDFDTWEEMGASGWGYRHVLPYFRRMETSHGAQSAWRGQSGPLHVTRGRLSNPLHRAFIEAGIEAGYGATLDYNGERQEGFGPMERTVWRGIRWSAANAYLRPAMKTGRVTLATGALADRVVFEGASASGVAYRQGGREKFARARKEVVLAAGPINSPAILMRSGIGDPAALKDHGIEIVSALEGVGRNLQDHLELYVQYAAKLNVTLHYALGLVAKGLIGLRWLLTGEGTGATNHFEAAGFIRSAAGVPYPDIQYHFLPLAVRYDGRAAAKVPGFQAHVGPMRSKSRGSVTLASAEAAEAPLISFDYMSHEDDWRDFRRAIRLTRELFAQKAFDKYRGEEIAPGRAAQSDEALDAYIREHVESAYHPCGTARMGREGDAGAVVDPQCRVIGVDRLRVADSSIFPQITNGNLNAPSIMVGEKAADMILGREPLPPSNLEPWTPKDWRHRQRETVRAG